LNDCASYGVNADETLVNVMWAYSKVDDEKFIQFAECLQSDLKHFLMTPLQSIMNEAEDEYKSRVQMGDWKAPTKQDIEITALKATINHQNIKTPKTPTFDQDKYEAHQANEMAKSPWKFDAPGPGEPWIKMMNNNTYHWCSKHKK
jgi:hypothetical protein